VLYDISNVVQERTSDGSTTNLLTGLGVDETHTRSDANGTNTRLVDALGSTLALANSSGVVQANYTYDATTLANSLGNGVTPACSRRRDRLWRWVCSMWQLLRPARFWASVNLSHNWNALCSGSYVPG
jgi:hypothetical protein